MYLFFFGKTEFFAPDILTSPFKDLPPDINNFSILHYMYICWIYIIHSIKGKYDVVSLSQFKKEYFKLIADEHIKSIMPISRYNKETGYYDLHLKVEPQKKMEVNVAPVIKRKKNIPQYLWSKTLSKLIE